MSDVALTAYLDRWVGENSAALRAAGIVATFGRGDGARSKSMAFCNLESAGWTGELLLWTSGEAELGATRRSDGHEVNEHHHVGSPQDLEGLLRRLKDMVASGQLHRFWITFHGDAHALPAGLAMGCGVTASSRDDAFLMLTSELLAGRELPPVQSVVVDVDVSTLDPDHVLPNVGLTDVRGIWFPRR
jgi:hypothetical protein